MIKRKTFILYTLKETYTVVDINIAAYVYGIFFFLIIK